jgi:replicative DNA helicase
MLPGRQRSCQRAESLPVLLAAQGREHAMGQEMLVLSMEQDCRVLIDRQVRQHREQRADDQPLLRDRDRDVLR